MHRVALTGGIATGKSYVRAHFEKLGVPTIDADVVARRVVEPGTPELAAVVARFGAGVLDDAGTLNRRTLANIVFQDPAARGDLEAVIHPAVRRETERWFRSLDASRHPVAIADIPLLYEVERDRDFDHTIVVACDSETQLRRLMQRDDLSESDARRRLAAQMPLDEKVRRADYVIRTDGTFEETDRQVEDVYRRLLERR